MYSDKYENAHPNVKCETGYIERETAATQILNMTKMLASQAEDLDNRFTHRLEPILTPALPAAYHAGYVVNNTSEDETMLSPLFSNIRQELNRINAGLLSLCELLNRLDV